MAEPEVQIDLGLDRDLPGQDDRPARHAGEGARVRARARAFAGAGCLALAMASLAASAPPPPPLMVRTATVAVRPTDAFVAAGGLVLVSSAAGTDATDRTLSAYELPTGRRRWRVHTSSGEGIPRQAQPVGDVLMIYGQAGGRTTTTARSAGTGAEIWSTTGYVDLADEGTTALVGVYRPPAGLELADSPAAAAGPTTVRAVDVPTGRTLWSTEFREFVASAITPDGNRVVIATGDGAVEVMDLRSGTTVLATRLPSPGHTSRAAVQVFAGAILVMDTVDGVTTALDPRTLAMRWRRVIQNLGVSGCGGLLCLMAARDGGSGVQAIEPATGAVLWSRTDVASVYPVAHRLVAFLGGMSAPSPAEVVDPATGRFVADLRGWEILAAAGDGPMVLTRPLAGRAGTEVGLLAAGAATVRVLGRLASIGTGCVGLERVVVCREGDRRLTVWRLRAP